MLYIRPPTHPTFRFAPSSSTIATNTAIAMSTATASATVAAAADTATAAANIAAVNARLDYLINDLRAYDDYTSTGGHGRRNGVKRLLHRWSVAQQGLETYTSPVPYPILKQQAKSRKLDDWTQEDLTSYTHIPSSATHHQVKDTHGNVLAYRLRIPQPLIDTLISTESMLPPIMASASVRGDMQHRHYCLWRKSAPEPFLSAEYKSQLPNSQLWLDANQNLFRRLSDDLRLINPECYVKFASIQPYLPVTMQPLCSVFPGLAINQCMTGDSGIHQDWGDYCRGFNCVVPWGNYTGGGLVLYQARIVYELQPGDVLYFYGNILAHNVVNIQGERNVLDLFCCRNLLSWKKKLQDQNK